MLLFNTIKNFDGLIKGIKLCRYCCFLIFDFIISNGVGVIPSFWSRLRDLERDWDYDSGNSLKLFLFKNILT